MPPQNQNLCQYKFYPTYMTASTVIQMKVEDLSCNEPASSCRFTTETRPTDLKRPTGLKPVWIGKKSC
ncbi:hypothetical protein G2W53_006275 [Senna tora]|uniref:Uncharacterized protein n=1 Tax=Senna tora TaxID=362788 RepID=A0A834X596_9FABA|nr:hypothetical protein G2W53_006275 [Senna tora]